MSSNRPIKIQVPEPLAEEIRLVAKASRRSAQEVAKAVFVGIFDGFTAQSIDDSWFAALRLELGRQATLDAGLEEVDRGTDR